MSKMWERAEFWPTERREIAPEENDLARAVAEARRTVEAEFASEREALLQLAGSLEVLQPPSATVIASLIVASVERLVVDIAGNATIDCDLLCERAAQLAAIVADQGEVMLAVHPDDAHLLGSTISTIGDRSLSRGTVEARTSTTTHEDGVRPALERMHVEMARMGLRP